MIEPETKEASRSNLWQSCCGCMIDRRATVFFSQLSIVMVLVAFCCYMLVQRDIECHEQNTYISLLTMVVGLFLPAPRIGKR